MDDIIERLNWIGTCLEKLIDINMIMLGTADPDKVELLDYIHNVKQQFLSELTEEELVQLQKEANNDRA